MVSGLGIDMPMVNDVGKGSHGKIVRIVCEPRVFRYDAASDPCFYKRHGIGVPLHFASNTGKKACLLAECSWVEAADGLSADGSDERLVFKVGKPHPFA